MTRMAGETVNYTTPGMYLGGEPMKAYLLSRHGVPLVDGMASVVTAKTTMTLAQVVFIMLGIGLGAVLLSRSNNLLVPSLLGLGLLGFGVGLFLAVQRFGLFMSLLRVLDRVGIRIAWLKAREGRLEALDSAIRDFYVRDRRGFLLSFASYFTGWLAGAVEVYLILYFLGLPVDWRTAIAIEALAVFAKGGTAFIPGSVGGQEAGTVLVFVAFGLTEQAGVTFALVRRLREIVWVAFGLWVLRWKAGLRLPRNRATARRREGMTVLLPIVWAGLAVLCAVGFGVVTGIVNPDEKVNGLWLVVAAACFYVLAYRFYGRFLARRVLELDNRRSTPAHRLNDGANFHPTNRWVLFGHHFAAIAGAGPLLGPVLAAQFGFLPGFLWLVVGAVLAGAVQDFVILVASMRRNGRSLPQIARDEIGAVTGLATAIAVLFVVVVALAGLGLAVVNALYRNPWGAFTLAMTVPIGFFMGFYLQRWRPGRVGEVSAIGAMLLVIAVVAGRGVAQSSLAAWFDLERDTLVWFLAAYGFLASVLPVWMLLVPRGYLSSFMKVSVVVLLGLGGVVMAA